MKAFTDKNNAQWRYSLSVIANAGIDVQDVIAYKPDQVGEIRYSRLVDHELNHGLLFDLVHVQSQRPHRDPDHAFAVIEKFDGLGVEREVVGMLQ